LENLFAGAKAEHDGKLCVFITSILVQRRHPAVKRGSGSLCREEFLWPLKSIRI